MDPAIKRHIDFLDPVRGLAILLVFVFHSLGAAFSRDSLPWGVWFQNFTGPRSFLALFPATLGWVGVAIFFVVSGFCIHLSFSRQPQWASFFWRRFFRIYPPYLAALLLFAFVYPITKLHFTSRIDTAQIVSHIFLVHNFDDRTLLGINPSFWTIAVEVQLYALYPILIALSRWLGWGRTLAGLAMIEIILRLADGLIFTASGAGLPRLLSGSPLSYWFSWSIGAFVAERYIRNSPLLIPRLFIYLLTAVAIGSSVFKPLAGMSFLLFALLTAAIAARLLAPGEGKLLLPDALRDHLRQVGLCSYSLYLLHQPFVLGVAALITAGVYIHPLFLFMVCLASWILIVPLAGISYRFCELPSIALGKRFQMRKGSNHPLPRTGAV